MCSRQQGDLAARVTLHDEANGLDGVGERIGARHGHFEDPDAASSSTRARAMSRKRALSGRARRSRAHRPSSHVRDRRSSRCGRVRRRGRGRRRKPRRCRRRPTRRRRRPRRPPLRPAPADRRRRPPGCRRSDAHERRSPRHPVPPSDHANAELARLLQQADAHRAGGGVQQDGVAGRDAGHLDHLGRGRAREKEVRRLGVREGRGFGEDVPGGNGDVGRVGACTRKATTSSPMVSSPDPRGVGADRGDLPDSS